jgi:hypothetical protein
MKNKMALTTNKHGFQTLQINNEKFDSSPDSIFDIPQKLIGEINITDFPVGLFIKPYKMILADEYRYGKMPIIIENIGNGMASLDIEACRSINDLYPVGMGDFQLIKAELILTMGSGNPEITICNNDESVAHLHYTIELPADTITNIIEAGIDFDRKVTEKVYDSMKTVDNDIRKKLGLTLI